MSQLSYGSWEHRVRRIPETSLGQKERRLFHDLNPHMEHSPLMKGALRNARPASVLIPIMVRPEGAAVLFTVRTHSMPSHAGEISFPGGGPKDGDDGPIGTALRETHEEVGIEPDRIDVIGTMGPHFGGLGYIVTPVIGLIRQPEPLDLSPREVDEVFEVPLEQLVNRDRHIVETRILNGVSYQMFAFPYAEGEQKRHIWGLTAGMLDTFSLAYHASEKAA